MKIFLDTGSVEEVKKALDIGILDGVTTNPTHIAKEGGDFETELLAASIRTPRQVVDVALLGADIVTISFKIYEQLYLHPLTDIGLKKFLKDWEGYKSKIKDQNAK